MDLGLKDKVALVGAASKGLGQASALALALEGARVTICARTEADLHAAAQEETRPGPATPGPRRHRTYGTSGRMGPLFHRCGPSTGRRNPGAPFLGILEVI